MNSNRATISDLRNLLREKHGSGQVFAPSRQAFRTGVDCLDAFGLQKGGLHEISAAPTSGGIGWITEQLISETGKHHPLVLIDGRDAFDADSVDDAALNNERFLWVRCREARDAIKATDWLLRDGNLPLVLLDLQMNPDSELKRIPAQSWYRLRSLAEETETTFVVFSAGKLVPCAHSRFSLTERFSLSVFDQRREKITLRIHVENQKTAEVSPLTTTTTATDLFSKAG